jgi:four helix bundle protein
VAKSFEDLDLWRRSCALSVRLYTLLKDCRDYGFKDRMLRSAISIPSNIVEGSERKNIPDFKRFISISQGSAAELRTQVYIAQEVKLIIDEDAQYLIEELK